MKLKKILNCLLIVILLLLLLLIIISAWSKIAFNKNDKLIYVFGWSLLTVTTESMQPEMDPGDIIIINGQINKANIGDIIIYRMEEGSLVTHRIIDKKNISGRIIYQLQGDANSLPDNEWVPQEDILGIYQLRLNKLVHVREFLRSPLLLAIILILISINKIFGIVKKQIVEVRRKNMNKYKR